MLTELALIKLTKPEMERDTEALLNRVANIEKMLESGVFVNQHISEVKMETMSVPLIRQIAMCYLICRCYNESTFATLPVSTLSEISLERISELSHRIHLA